MGNLRDELLAIRDKYGSLTPANVVEAARDEDHPLHSRFEWDDAIAGEKYRLVQARQLIRVVRQAYVDGNGKPASVRVFHSNPQPDGTMAYDPADEIAQDDVALKVLLASMEREWRQLKARYDRFAEFRAMVLRDLAQPAEPAA